MKRLLAVKASAGSGKTFRLVNRYISLLTIDNPTNIIAITFTNKAANEMKERIVKELYELGNDINIVYMICKELNISKDELLNRKEKLIKKFLSLDTNIQTIDSFFNKILRKFNSYVGIRNSFDIGSDDKELIFNNFLYSLNESDVKKLVYFIKKEKQFFKNLVDLFENLYEKDKELKNVRLDFINKPDDTKAKREFNKLKKFILNSNINEKGKKFFNINFYDIPTKGWFKKESLNYWYYKKIYQDWFDDVLKEIQTFFKEYFRYKEYQFFKNLTYFYEKYKKEKWKYKKNKNLFNLKDIEYLVYDLLQEEGIDNDFLYFRLDSKINHILIDEFQKTSITQWEIFEPIIDEIVNGFGRKEIKTFFYIGDKKQTICKLRESKKVLFDYVAEKYKPHGLDVEELTVNYKNAKNIVGFVNNQLGIKERASRYDEGYVEVDRITKEDVYEIIYEKINFLNYNGVKDNDIAILVYNNEDISNIGNFLENKGKKVITTKKAKVLSQKSAKAIVSLMKYLENNQKQIELLNFLSLTEKKWGEKINIRIDRPVKMIKEIIDKYDLLDEASLKLLNHSRKYDTLFDFVIDIDNYSETLSLKKFEGITITTIHKSKEIEYESVIVVDRLSKENNKNSIIYDYDGIKLKDLKLRIPNREIIDNDYKLVLKKEEKFIEECNQNLEYVAFTKAKNNLIILKRDDKSAFTINLEIGFKKGEVIPSANNNHQKISPIKIKLKNYGKQIITTKRHNCRPKEYEKIYFNNAINYAFECKDIEAVRNHYGIFCNIQKIKEIYIKAKKYLFKGNREVPFIFNGTIKKVNLLTKDSIINYKVTTNNEKMYISEAKQIIDIFEQITGKKYKFKIFYLDKIQFKDIEKFGL